MKGCKRKPPQGQGLKNENVLKLKVFEFNGENYIENVHEDQNINGHNRKILMES